MAHVAAILIATGAFLAVVFTIVGIWIGRALTDPTGAQVRQTVRDLITARKALQRQLGAARNAVSRIVTDPRTHPHDRLVLEEHVQPLLVERRSGE